MCECTLEIIDLWPFLRSSKGCFVSTLLWWSTQSMLSLMLLVPSLYVPPLQLFTISHRWMALFWRSMLLTVRASHCWEGRRVLPSSGGHSRLCGYKLWNLQNFQWPKRNNQPFSLNPLIGLCSLSFSAHCISLNKMIYQLHRFHLKWPPLAFLPLLLFPLVRHLTRPLFFLCPSDRIHSFLISTFSSAMSTRDRLILVPSSATSVNSCERLCVTYDTCAVIVCIFSHH